MIFKYPIYVISILKRSCGYLII